MPRLSEAMKDAISCDNPRLAAHRRLIRGFPNGATHYVEDIVSSNGSQPGELKHLSTRRKRKQLVIPQVVASERGLAQTHTVTAVWGL